MKQVTYTDSSGRKFATLVPDEIPEHSAQMGIPVGPPPLEDLGLPLETEVRLNNALFNRGLLRAADVRARPNDVVSAVMSAYKADAARVMDLYWDSPQ